MKKYISPVKDVILFTNRPLKPDENFTSGPDALFEKISGSSVRDELLNFEGYHLNNEPFTYKLKINDDLKQAIEKKIKEKYPTSPVSYEDMQDLVQHFRLAVNQPNRHEMTRYMKHLLESQYQNKSRIDIERIYDHVEDKIISWYEDKRGMCPKAAGSSNFAFCYCWPSGLKTKI